MGEGRVPGIGHSSLWLPSRGALVPGQARVPVHTLHVSLFGNANTPTLSFQARVGIEKEIEVWMNATLNLGVGSCVSVSVP